MKKLGLTVAIVGALGAAACSGGTTNNSAGADRNDSIEVNTSAIGQSLENGMDDAGNFAAKAGESIENGLNKAGDVIENTARGAYNGAAGAVDGAQKESGAETNKSGNR